jgi:hypothetical protein
VATSLDEHWMLFLVEGIVPVMLGPIAIVVRPIATLAVEVLFDWLFSSAVRAGPGCLNSFFRVDKWSVCRG